MDLPRFPMRRFGNSPSGKKVVQVHLIVLPHHIRLCQQRSKVIRLTVTPTFYHILVSNKNNADTNVKVLAGIVCDLAGSMLKFGAPVRNASQSSKSTSGGTTDYSSSKGRKSIA